jgi:hypothetical protein
MFSIKQFHFIKDPANDIPLNQVMPISLRIWTLFARNREKQILHTGFLNLNGTIDMTSGLEYHYANFMDTVSRLSELPFVSDETNRSENSLRHEIIAYLNRMGQFYHFAKSSFVTRRIPNALDFIPTISKFKVFRDQHSAHRSIDYPHKEDSVGVQQAQAWGLSSVGGLHFRPKENSKPPTNENEWMDSKRRWTQRYLCFQMRVKGENEFLNFIIEQEHPRIIAEAFNLVEKLIELN